MSDHPTTGRLQRRILNIYDRKAWVFECDENFADALDTSPLKVIIKGVRLKCS